MLLSRRDVEMIIELVVVAQRPAPTNVDVDVRQKIAAAVQAALDYNTRVEQFDGHLKQAEARVEKMVAAEHLAGDMERLNDLNADIGNEIKVIGADSNDNTKIGTRDRKRKFAHVEAKAEALMKLAKKLKTR